VIFFTVRSTNTILLEAFKASDLKPTTYRPKPKVS